MRRRAHTPREGFTLIELLAVLIIISLMMGLALVRADSFIPRYQLDSEAGDLAGMLRDARNRAIVFNRTLRLEIDAQGGTISYYYDEPVPQDDPLTWRGDEPFLTRAWSDRLILDHACIGGDAASTTGLVVLKFWPAGVCTPVRLYVQHVKGVELKCTVQINPLTGLTTVQSGFVNPETYESQAAGASSPRR